MNQSRYRQKQTRMPKKHHYSLLMIFVCFSLLTNPNSVQAAQWNGGTLQTPPQHARVTLIDTNAAFDAYSSIRINRIQSDSYGSGGATLSHCIKWGEAPCTLQYAKTTAFTFHPSINLPYCKDNLYSYCVEKVKIFTKDTKAEEANFLGTSTELTVGAIPEVGLPAGGGSLLFVAPGSKHKGGEETYFVRAKLEMQFNSTLELFEPNGFAIVVQPYSSRPSEITYKTALKAISRTTAELASFQTEARQWYPNEGEITGGTAENNIALTENTIGVFEDFSSNTRVQISVRIPKNLGGWFSGRLTDPVIALDEANEKFNQLEVTASSAEVPRISAVVPNDKYTPQMIALNMPRTNSLGGSFEANIESGFDTGVTWVEELRGFIADKAVGQTNVWVLRKSPDNGQKCFPKNKFSGLVTTNATAYSWNPPVYSNGYLDYRVAGPHFNIDGSEVQGTYDLILSSSVARCIYGFSSAPVSATISIIGDGAEAKSISTTLVSEGGGWLKLAAYGFTFSSPVVRVLLSQSQANSVKTLDNSLKPKNLSPKLTNTKLRTISCKKNLKVLKVTGKMPTCPSGFKKV